MHHFAQHVVVIQKDVKLEFDPAKSVRNDAERGLPFERVAWLDWERAVAYVDTRADYGETRVVALATLNGRLHVVCYFDRGDTRQIISFRKANKREEKIYETAITDR